MEIINDKFEDSRFLIDLFITLKNNFFMLLLTSKNFRPIIILRATQKERRRFLFNKKIWISLRSCKNGKTMKDSSVAVASKQAKQVRVSTASRRCNYRFGSANRLIKRNTHIEAYSPDLPIKR